MDNFGNSALSEGHPASKAALIIFSPFLLENNYLLTAANRFYHGFDISALDVGPAYQRITLGSHKGDLFEKDLR
jgi:hypothetical protein